MVVVLVLAVELIPADQQLYSLDLFAGVDSLTKVDSPTLIATKRLSLKQYLIRFKLDENAVTKFILFYANELFSP